MRESNFSFPSQNRACVCITSQLYDRRALDTNAALPLLNSLTHLTYLTSTSPRIREILTLDGGLERLVRVLRQYCANPVSPSPGLQIYHLVCSAVDIQERKPGQPILTAASGPNVDRAKTYQFSLAFQCVVNIGVRGSEIIRSRVVQAGMLDVVASVLETWLKSKGFALGPSPTGSGAPRETREQRQARRAARERELQARELRLAIQSHLIAGRTIHPAVLTIANQAPQQALLFSPSPSMNVNLPAVANMFHAAIVEEPTSAGSHSAMTSGDEAGSADADGDEEMVDSIPGRDEPIRPIPLIAGSRPPSMQLARPMHDPEPDSRPHSAASTETSAESTPVRSRTPTASVLVSGRDRSGTVVGRPTWDSIPSVSEQPEGRRRRSRRTEEEEDDNDAMDVESEAEPPTANSQHTRAVGIVDIGEEGMNMMLSPGMDIPGAGVAQGFVTLEPNDDLAMGAPPGAPGAHTPTPLITMPMTNDNVPRQWEDMTPRAAFLNLPNVRVQQRIFAQPPTNPLNRGGTVQRTLESLTNQSTINADGKPEPVKYRDDDVLIALQLLAYLSKYPHVRQAFYRPRDPYYPAPPTEEPKPQEGNEDVEVASTVDEPRRPRKVTPAKQSNGSKVTRPAVSGPPQPGESSNLPLRSSLSTTQNVFSLVERFTFRPSPSEPNLPALPKDIQYWAGVIMRNACRKDESRGGIRQCANMSCGRWEEFPREFAKCRRCRKAKYCGKECQSRAWAEGHRFWCNQRDDNNGEGSSTVPAGRTPGVQDGLATAPHALVPIPEPDAANRPVGAPFIAPTPTPTPAPTITIIPPPGVVGGPAGDSISASRAAQQQQGQQPPLQRAQGVPRGGVRIVNAGNLFRLG
ncbi:hypothetical protein DACRYDRAFT_98489 [Dacryopinax primogenitus]|uniref:MYND-type domain-containing protein n=1 Tax=Dacryopinax primogenitus (strain DJM 731) TaxID=1858805 RepID=M5G2X3_DACPD|nr:uncharacterized protein DACRYDRAFT_98489 [Dacryopinax primogenitus]EJU04581.1 hypothetical protein DACRYDRAFT_98489 [Dacryopinax primogenitus]